MNSRIKITTEKYLPSLELAKIALKWERILAKSAPIGASLEIMFDHDYVKIFSYASNINLEFQWTEKEKSLYLTMESSEAIRNAYNGSVAFYDTPIHAIMGYLLHQDTGCHKFANISAAFEFIYMFELVLHRQ